MINKSFWEKIAVALFLLLLLSCKTKNTEVEPAPHWFDEYSSFNKKDYQQYLSQEINALSPDFVLFGNAVKQFYQQRDYEPLWTLNGLQEHKIDTLFQFLSASYTHGLPVSFFYQTELDSNIAQLKNYAVENRAEILYPYLFNIEKQLTTAYLRYATALQFGATDPKLVNGNKWFYQTRTADSMFVAELLQQWTSLSSTLSSVASQDSSYLRLQQELQHLYPFKDSVFDPLTVKQLSQNQTDEMVYQLCKRLQLTGELPSDFVAMDTLSEAVMAAVNLFRANNAIPESPDLDEETIEKLNRPISYYLDKLSVNMERLRWKVLPEKGEDYIAVNLPDFTLRTFRQGEMVFKTNVCCGKSQNPQGDEERYQEGLISPFKSETPLLSSEITRIVLNPEWNIPYSILKDEYYPKLLKSNTAVIHRENLYVVQASNRKQIDPESIDWHNVNRKNIPYRLIQSSGKYNSLGLVKFDFANTESVYLHDTNNKSAFKKRKRAISHGCVRVQNPFELAAVLYEMNDFDEQKIEELGIIVGNPPTTEEGEEFLKKKEEKEEEYYQRLSDEKKHFYRKLRPTSIRLENPMPLYIEYYTCFVGDNNCIQYREDVYYKDENISYLIKNQ